MKLFFQLCFLILCFTSYAQHDQKISTLDFIEVLNGNHKEALYFYKNNWKKLREIALERDYIHSFQLLETEAEEEYPFSFILITTYSNEEQFKKREEHFAEVMKLKGGLELWNKKKPVEFRKTLFSREKTFHLD